MDIWTSCCFLLIPPLFVFVVGAYVWNLIRLAKGFALLLPDVENALRALGKGAEEMAEHYRRLPPDQKLQLATLLLNTFNSYNQLSSLSKARYDARMGDIMGMAASAGIDWQPQ